MAVVVMMPSENMSNLAWRHAEVIAGLPEPPKTFRYAETDLTHSQLRLFNQNNLIEVAKESDREQRAHQWVVREDVYERATQHAEETDGFSCCGATGVTNDEGTLRCKQCGAVVSTEEFRRVL